MNPSRVSYSYPTDFNQAFSTDVILQSCEFCSRTFIPDSLAKHRKTCYKDYLKRRSKATKNSSSTRSKSARMNAGDIPGMNFSDLMMKRQVRRMNWRNRHEEFINSIREARDYATATSCGLKVQAPSSTTETHEDMQPCKYCLRKFHKDSFEKHTRRCKEYSIRSTRSRPNEEQIEAKRRLSLRLYYKPKSYRGDSPDDFSTSFSSNDFDSESMSTLNSQRISNRRSRAATSIDNSKCKRQCSVLVPRSEASNDGKQIKRHKSTVMKVQREPMKTSQSTAQTYSKPQSKSQILNQKNLMNSKNILEISTILKSVSKCPEDFKNIKSERVDKCFFVDQQSTDSKQSIKSSKSHLNHQSISYKLKAISNLLNNKAIEQDNCSLISNEVNENVLKCELPDPAESLKKAKEILQLLDVRIQQQELLKDTQPFLVEMEEEKYKQLNTNHEEPHFNYSFDNDNDDDHDYDGNNFFRNIGSKTKTDQTNNCYTMKEILPNVVVENIKKRKFYSNTINRLHNKIELVQNKQDIIKNDVRNKISNTKEVMIDESNNSVRSKDEISVKQWQNYSSLNHAVPTAHADPDYAKIWQKL